MLYGTKVTRETATDMLEKALKKLEVQTGLNVSA
jgi:hypothetical protein